MTDRSPLAARLERPIPVGDVTLHDCSLSEAAALIAERARLGTGGYVCTPNADYVVKAHANADFRAAIQGASLRLPDGMWVVYASRIAGQPLHQTVTGRLLLPEVAARLTGSSAAIALFGAGPGIAAEAAKRLSAVQPGVRIAAAVSPPMRLQIGSDADQRAVDGLIEVDPAVIFVGLGAPLEVLWMERHAKDFPRSILIGIGAGIDLAAGRFRTAPQWMTRIGLEWLFRLLQEPRRLARRYLVEDPWILWWAVRTRLGVR